MHVSVLPDARGINFYRKWPGFSNPVLTKVFTEHPPFLLDHFVYDHVQ